MKLDSLRKLVGFQISLTEEEARSFSYWVSNRSLADARDAADPNLWSEGQAVAIAMARAISFEKE